MFKPTVLLLLLYHSLEVETALSPIVSNDALLQSSHYNDGHDYDLQLTSGRSRNSSQTTLLSREKLNLKRRQYDLTNEFDIVYVNIHPFDLIIGPTYQPLNLEVLDEIHDVVQNTLLMTMSSSTNDDLDFLNLWPLTRDVELAGAKMKFRGDSSNRNHQRTKWNNNHSRYRFLEAPSFNEPYTTLIRMEGGVAEFAFSMLYLTPSTIELNEVVLKILSDHLLPEIQQISALSSVTFVNAYDEVVTEKPTSSPTPSPTPSPTQVRSKGNEVFPTLEPSVIVPKRLDVRDTFDKKGLDSSSKREDKLLYLIIGTIVAFVFFLIGFITKRKITSKQIRSYESSLFFNSSSNNNKLSLRDYNNETFNSDLEDDSISSVEQRSTMTNANKYSSIFMRRNGNDSNNISVSIDKMKADSFELARDIDTAILEKGMLNSSTHYLSTHLPPRQEYVGSSALTPTDFSPSMFVLSNSLSSDTNQKIDSNNQYVDQDDDEFLFDESWDPNDNEPDRYAKV